MELPDQTGDQESKKKIVVIPQEMGIPTAIAGYILTKTGNITPDMEVVVRAGRRLSTPSSDVIHLFKRETLNPTSLLQVIDKSNVNLDRQTVEWLNWLAVHTQYYRAFSVENWWQAGGQINHWGKENKALHKDLCSVLFLCRDDPKQAFAQCQLALEGSLVHPSEDERQSNIQAFVQSQQTLDKTLTHPIMLSDDVLRTDLSTPFLKNSDDGPDVVEYGNASFDRARVLVLNDAHFSFVVGGSPHSGKSTFTASLADALTQIVEGCKRDGIIGEQDISATGCELDLGTPTLQFIGNDEAMRARQKRTWDIALANQAVESLRASQINHTITIGDLPGGTPPNEDITLRIAREADFSIRVDKNFGNMGNWREFLYGPHIPSPLILVHTRKDEIGRESGVRIYTSRQRGDRDDLLQGRVVNLDLKSKPEDPFIMLVAHAILFDFLPEAVLAKMRYGQNILRSIQA